MPKKKMGFDPNTPMNGFCFTFCKLLLEFARRLDKEERLFEKVPYEECLLHPTSLGGAILKHLEDQTKIRLMNTVLFRERVDQFFKDVECLLDAVNPNQ